MAAKRKQGSTRPPEPPEHPGGKWVWVPDGLDVRFRNSDHRREYMRQYMKTRRRGPRKK